MILVTGAAGYIGSHTVLSLLEKGKKIIIFDNLSTGHLETIKTLEKFGSVEFIKGDLRNKEDIDKVFKYHQITDVIHFAALSVVSESVREPEKYYENNVLGSKNLFDTMIKYKVLRIVFSSSAAVYGEPKYTPIDESHPLNPINPYGKTKLKIENTLKEYGAKYGLKSVCLRYFNAAGADNKARIGEWHNPETHLIPNVIKSCLNNVPVKIFGNDYATPDGTCIRDYIDVNDLALAHILALEYLNNGGKSDVFNLGTGKGVSVKEILKYTSDITGKKINFEILPKRKGDPKILLANVNKAKEILGWKAEKTILDSILSAYNREQNSRY